MTTIQVWRWDDAPRRYRDLSTNGGDEDWVAFVPNALKGIYIGWIENCNGFGSSIDEYPVEGGMVYIGSHA